MPKERDHETGDGMPHIKEKDVRDGRFESEIQDQQMLAGAFQRKSVPYCKRCNMAFEDKSRFCPNCSRANRTNEMGTLSQIPPEDAERITRENVKKLQRRYR